MGELIALEVTCQWRVGRTVGRTIYAQPNPDHDGLLIGVMDSPELAAEVVAAHNYCLTNRIGGRREL